MKTYSLKTLGTSHTLPIPMDGANYYVNFEKIYSGERLAYFSTDNPKLQKAIEESQFWQSGEIKLVGKVEDKDKAAAEAVQETAEEVTVIESASEVQETAEVQETTEQKPVVHAEVTKFQEAKNILQAEPYKVAHQALGSPDKVFKKAAELGISFPNLKIDEE